MNLPTILLRLDQARRDEQVNADGNRTQPEKLVPRGLFLTPEVVLFGLAR